MDKKFIYELNKDENRSKKREYVNEVFCKIAPVYDLMNNIMSMGLHRSWRRESVRPLKVKNNFRVLDIASGTCDFAIAFAEHTSQIPGRIVSSDLCWDMLAKGRDKVIAKGFGDKFGFCIAEAENLPFPDSYFDVVSISCGIRNTTDIPMSLREIMRVLRPGGNFISLDLGKPDIPIFKELYNFYFFNIVPRVGKVILGESDPYNYLPQSLLTFPSQDEFQLLMRKAGFETTSYKNFLGGAMAVHYGTKPQND